MFIMCNTRGIDDAKAYKGAKGLTSSKVFHTGNRPPADYGLKYIPHKVVIDSSGAVVKNFDDVDLTADLASLS